MEMIKKKMRLLYSHYPEVSETHELKVICKERWGDDQVAKCKVIGGKGWYHEVYITMMDLHSGRVRIKE